MSRLYRVQVAVIGLLFLACPSSNLGLVDGSSDGSSGGSDDGSAETDGLRSEPARDETTRPEPEPEPQPEPENTAPIARTADLVEAQVGVAAHFDGSTSSDADGQIVEFLWDFGDGQTAVGEQVTHAFAEPGSFSASLSVTDDDGATGQQVIDVVVSLADNAAPVAVIDLPDAVLIGEPVTFDASGSHDSDGEVVAWDWSFQPTEPPFALETGAGASLEHTFTELGGFEVRLQVTGGRCRDSRRARAARGPNPRHPVAARGNRGGRDR